MLCETFWYEPEFEVRLADEEVPTMAGKPLRAQDAKLEKLVDGEWKNLHDGGPIEPGLTQGGTLIIAWHDHWYDPVLRFVLCRLTKKHRWMHCSAYVNHVPDAQPGYGRNSVVAPTGVVAVPVVRRAGRGLADSAERTVGEGGVISECMGVDRKSVV